MSEAISSVPAASEQLILSLERSEAELRSVSHRLEQEFGERFKGQPANPFSIVQRLRKLERELMHIRSDYAQLATARQELLERAGKTVKYTSQLISQLEKRAGLPTDGDDSKHDTWLISSKPDLSAA